jgi:membrane associated rhomboid family serine protease
VPVDDERLGEIVFGLAAIAFGIVIVVGALAGATSGLIALVAHATIAVGLVYYLRVIRPRRRARDRGQRID